MLFLVTLVLLDLLLEGFYLEGFNLSYECSQNKQLPAQQNGNKFFLLIF